MHGDLDLGAEFGEQVEAPDVGEDRVMRDQGNVQPDRCGRHPPVRLVLLLAQAVPVLDAPCAERRVSAGQVRPRPDGFCSLQLALKPAQPSWPSCGEPGSEAEFRHRDE